MKEEYAKHLKRLEAMFGEMDDRETVTSSDFYEAADTMIEEISDLGDKLARDRDSDPEAARLLPLTITYAEKLRDVVEKTRPRDSNDIFMLAYQAFSKGL